MAADRSCAQLSIVKGKLHCIIDSNQSGNLGASFEMLGADFTNNVWCCAPSIYITLSTDTYF